MRETDRPAFIEAITVLATAFARELSEPLFEAYWIGLRDLTPMAVKEAVGRAINTSKFMPPPAELRELAGQMTPTNQAVHAWQAVLKAFATCGYYKSVDFDDPLINATLRNLGGWMRVIERMDEEGDKWIHKEFEATYKAFAATGVSSEMALPLQGFHEQQNVLTGHEVEGPARIETGIGRGLGVERKELTGPDRRP